MKTVHLPIESIGIRGETQAREVINMDAVAEYAAAMEEGENLPPAVVFFDGAQYHLADGFHRWHAHRKIGATTFECEVRTGTLLDAKLYAYGANKAHGLQRTNADKRKAVLGMLADFSDWTDREIARHVGVSHPFVAGVRNPEVVERQKETRTPRAPKVETVSTSRAASASDSVAGSAEPEGPRKITATDWAFPATGPASSATDTRDALIAEQAAQIEDMKRVAGDLIAENNRIGDVFDADDKLAAAMAANAKLAEEIKNLKALLKTADERVNGLLFEKSEMASEMSSLRRQVAKLKKSVATA